MEEKTQATGSERAQEVDQEVTSQAKRWYVLHTYSGYENRVKSNLESRAQSMGMEDYIFRVIVPEETVHQVKDGKTKDIEEKVFPGYVLVEMVMTCWGIILPLWCSAVRTAFSSPPQQGTCIRTTVTLRISF